MTFSSPGKSLQTAAGKLHIQLILASDFSIFNYQLPDIIIPCNVLSDLQETASFLSKDCFRMSDSRPAAFSIHSHPDKHGII